MRRHSKTHLADYFEITLAEWKHCCILYAESHMVKKCYNQFYSDKTGLIYGVFLWMSLQCLIGVFFFFPVYLLSPCSSTSKAIFFLLNFSQAPFFSFCLYLKQTNKQDYGICVTTFYFSITLAGCCFLFEHLRESVRRQFIKLILC